MQIEGPSGQSAVVNAIIDTGYNGYLSLPPQLIRLLGLPWLHRQVATLADGTVISFNVYSGTVIWDGKPRTIPIDELDTDPLIGMRLPYGMLLVMHIVDGGNVYLTS